MAPFAVNEDAVFEFKDLKALNRWYAKNHATAPEMWIKIHKKGSGLPSVTNVEGFEEALCWGWIDAIRKPFDDKSFLQRYTPRGKKSIWSERNRTIVARLIKEGRMQPAGQAQIDLAKADGRWAKAYGGFSRDKFPADLMAAIAADPKALKMFETLNAQNRYSLGFRTHNMKTEAGRTKKIAQFVDMLRRGETIYPNGKPR